MTIAGKGKTAKEATSLAKIQNRLDAVLGAERLDDAMAARLGVRLYDVTYKGRLVKVTVPENDGA